MPERFEDAAEVGVASLRLDPLRLAPNAQTRSDVDYGGHRGDDYGCGARWGGLRRGAPSAEVPPQKQAVLRWLQPPELSRQALVELGGAVRLAA